MRRISSWFPLGLLIALAVMAFWLDYTVQPPATTLDGRLRHDPDYIVENFSAVRMGDDGKPLYTVSASRMLHFPDDDSSHLQQANFVHFDQATAPLRISSKIALITKDGENAYFRDDVIVVRDAYADYSLLTIKTDYLHVLPDENVAKTDQPVTIIDANSTIDAVGLELDNEARTLKLLARVKGRYEPAR